MISSISITETIVPDVVKRHAQQNVRTISHPSFIADRQDLYIVRCKSSNYAIAAVALKVNTS